MRVTFGLLITGFAVMAGSPVRAQQAIDPTAVMMCGEMPCGLMQPLANAPGITQNVPGLIVDGINHEPRDDEPPDLSIALSLCMKHTALQDRVDKDGTQHDLVTTWLPGFENCDRIKAADQARRHADQIVRDSQDRSYIDRMVRSLPQ